MDRPVGILKTGGNYIDFIAPRGDMITLLEAEIREIEGCMEVYA
jgi:hypothetical protein